MIPSFYPKHPYQSMTLNSRGQDYFVGDVHGNFEGLSQAMTEIGFDVTRDRLIVAGDLIDRGENSDVALAWLEQPFFFSIRGNHENLYLRWRSLRTERDRQRWFEENQYFIPRNGGRWVLDVDEPQHRLLEEAFSRLPYFLAVPSKDGRVVGMIHAELPDGATWPGIITQSLNDDLIEIFTWGRGRLLHDMSQKRPDGPGETVGPADDNRIAGLDALVCGHAFVKTPRVLGNIVYLDTGGWHKKGYFSLLSLEQILQKVQSEAA